LEKLLAYLSFLIPGRFLTTKYLFKRLDLISADPATCDHEWWVVASILETVELQVQCYNCMTYSEVTKPTEGEWADSYGAMENPYRWEDVTRIRLYEVAGTKH